MEGFKVMHELKIVHHDIKPGNILISKEGLIKIADFNVSRVLSGSDEHPSTLTGTIFYCF